MTSEQLLAGIVAAVTPAPLVVMLVLVGGGRVRQALAAAVKSVLMLAASAELFRRTDTRVPSLDGETATTLLGVAFLATAVITWIIARRGSRRRELPWVGLLDEASAPLAATIMFVITVCNIKNQALLALAMRDADRLDPVLYALVGASGVLALYAIGAVLPERRNLLRAAHDWLERWQTPLAIASFAVVGCLLVAAGVATER